MPAISTGITIPRLDIDIQTESDKARILRYIAPSPDLVRRTKLLLRSMLVIGPMGYGKTSFVEAKLGEAIERLLDHGIDEREIGYFYMQETPISRIVAEIKENRELPRLTYLFIFVDDAPAAEGLHGRRALAKENVAESQVITMIRHRLKEAGYTGYVFLAWTSQVYHLVDITVRRTSALKIFKDYPEEDDMKLVGRMLGAAGMRALALLSDWLSSDDPLRFLQAVYAGVAKMKRRRWLITTYTCNGFPNCELTIEELENEVNRKKRYLEHVVQLNVESEYVNDNSIELQLQEIDGYKDCRHVINRILEDVNISSRGVNFTFSLEKEMWMLKKYFNNCLKFLGFRPLE